MFGPTAISSMIAQSKLDYSQGFCQWEWFKYQRAVIITAILDLPVVANDQLESSERLSQWHIKTFQMSNARTSLSHINLLNQ